MTHWAYGPNREAVLARLSESHKGIRRTAEERKKISVAMKGRPRVPGSGRRKGSTFTDEQRECVAAGHRGKPWTPAQRAALGIMGDDRDLLRLLVAYLEGD